MLLTLISVLCFLGYMVFSEVRDYNRCIKLEQQALTIRYLKDEKRALQKRLQAERDKNAVIDFAEKKEA